MTEQFHIGEWYGRPFLELSNEERLEMANHTVGSGMPKVDADRLVALRLKASTKGLSTAEQRRLETLENMLARKFKSERVCPFRTDTPFPFCTKKGGVCSLQLVSQTNDKVAPVKGGRGELRALCPYRFHQDDMVFKHIGKTLLDDIAPRKIGEVGFLASSGNLDSEPGEDVGKIDMILVKENDQKDAPISWAAVEIQAVYFSGREMSLEFKNQKENGGQLTMPAAKRRPDYRSSGPKRLMPQLQIKVPTLRRWGKKMAVVVDRPFFHSMGEMRTASDVSNADIIWFIVDFKKVEHEQYYQIQIVDEVVTTLESSIEGLTGGIPVSLKEFENRILGK